MRLSILSDKALTPLPSFLPEGTEVRWFDPEAGLPDNTTAYHALIVRTVTPINRHTLPTLSPNKPLKFIGTASAGSDHIDRAFLEEHGVRFAFAAGCNARRVGEYVVVVLLWYAESQGLDLRRLPVGIVGVGQTGRAVNHFLKALSIPSILYDPPRQAQEPTFISASRKAVLECPILTFHTPLTYTGNDPTFHWLSRDTLHQAHFELIINAARGGVIDEAALVAAHREGNVRNFALDVWEGEPMFREESARRAWIASPHIAGYSREAKARACRLIACQLIEHFALEEKAAATEPTNKPATVTLSSRLDTLAEVLRQVHPLAVYHRKMKALTGIPNWEKSRNFNRLRTTIPLQHEFSQIALPPEVLSQFPALAYLGFKV